MATLRIQRTTSYYTSIGNWAMIAKGYSSAYGKVVTLTRPFHYKKDAVQLVDDILSLYKAQYVQGTRPYSKLLWYNLLYHRRRSYPPNN